MTTEKKLLPLYIGWMYAAELNHPEKWEPRKIKSHKYQRRNWIRVRVKLLQQGGDEHHASRSRQGSTEVEYWEYGDKSDHSLTFHAIQKSSDCSMRCHWVRKLVYVDSERLISKR